MGNQNSFMPKNSYEAERKMVQEINNSVIAPSKSTEAWIAFRALFSSHQSELESAYVIHVLICC